MLSRFLPLLPCLFLAACGGGERVDRALEEKILLRANGAEPSSLDPHIYSGEPENNIASALFEGLIGLHPTDDNLPEPGVAESWEQNEDASIWTFKIREDAKWSDGKKITAQDFIWTMKRGLAPALANEYAPILYKVKGAKEFNEGTTDDFSTVGIEELEDGRLRYHLIGPTPYFLSMLKHHSFWPVPQQAIEARGKYDERGTDWLEPEHFVGNGPFVLEEWLFKNVIKVKKNPLYWDADRVELNGIHFFAVENVTTEERMFRDGQVHITKEVSLDKIPWYLNEHPDLIQNDPQLVVYYYVLNTTKKPLDDKRVRHALSLTVDREAIVKGITRAGERAAWAFVPAPAEGVETGYQPPKIVTYDPDKARALLAEAGFPGGKGFPKFEILINTHESHRKIGEAIQEMWKNELGIDVGVRNESWQVYQDSLRDLKHDIGRRGWIGDYMDPITFLSILKSGDANNATGFADPKYDGLLDQTDRMGDADARFDVLREAETYLLEEAPVIPIYWYVTKHLIHPDLKGWYPKLQDMHPYKYMSLERDADYVSPSTLK